MRTSRQNDAFGLLAVLFAAALLCVYSTALNTLFYSAFGPFFDSLSYLNHLAVVMNASREIGAAAGWKAALGTTVFLPWVEGLIASAVTGAPSRSIAVWLQAPWLLALGATGYFYFRSVAAYPVFFAAACGLALVSFNALFFYNGGLSDLRMDLLQALTFGAVLASFFVARRQKRWPYWFGAGLLMAVACLVRATTPVYIVLVIGLIAVFDLATSKDRWLLFRMYLLMAAVPFVLALWFYILNFNELFYYYFVWNTDANAKLPLSSSIKHVEFLLFQHIGVPLLLFLCANFAIRAVAQIRIGAGSLIRNLNWTALWAGVAPVTYLVLSGAGLNPFVSMVSVPGFLFFMLTPFAPGVRLRRPIEGGLAVAACLACLATAQDGIANHTTRVASWIPSQQGLNAVVASLVTDARSRSGRGSSTFQVGYVGSLVTEGLVNSLAYDHGFKLRSAQCAVRDGLVLSSLSAGIAQPAEWAAIPGATDAEKVAFLTSQAERAADYLILPEASSDLNQTLAINPHMETLRRLVAESGSFAALGAPISVSRTESVQIYRNTKLQRGPTDVICP